MRFFGQFFWPVCMHLVLDENGWWFLNFNDAPSILDDYFKFLCVKWLSKTERVSSKF
jgi:hypothetical protein